jgi:voltage-dependent calcium channel L type alpha-1D
LNETQKGFIYAKLLILASTPIKFKIPLERGIRKFFYTIAKGIWFENLILICIILNSIILMIKFQGQSDDLVSALENVNLVFTIIFTLEAIIKIVAYGKDYFKDGWNIFDFLVVMLSLVGIITTQLTSINLGSKTTIIRALRICRVLRLIKRAKRLYFVFNTLIATLPAMGNIATLLCLLVYIYTVIGI